MAQVLKAGDKINVGGTNKVVSAVAASVNAVTKTALSAVSIPAGIVSLKDHNIVLSEITPSGKAVFVAG